MRLFELVSASLFFALFTAVLFLTTQMPVHRNPMTSVGVAPGILSATLVILSVRWWFDAQKRYRTAPRRVRQHPEKTDGETRVSSTGGRRLVLAIASTLVYVLVLTPVITFLPATFIFLFVTMRLFSTINWKRRIVVSAALVGVIYGVFGWLLHLPLPR